MAVATVAVAGPAAHGGVPPSHGTAPAGSATPAADTPVGDRGSDGGAVAVWVAGEVVVLVAAAVALRLWIGRRSGRAPRRAGVRPVPADACDTCPSGGPCTGVTAPRGRCDHPPVRIRL